MLLRAGRLLLGVWVVAGLALPAMAQPIPPPQNPPRGLPCEAFTRDIEGDWIAKKDMMVPAASGMMPIKAGQPVDEELQQRLDDQCEVHLPR